MFFRVPTSMIRLSITSLIFQLREFHFSLAYTKGQFRPLGNYQRLKIAVHQAFFEPFKLYVHILVSTDTELF